MQKLFFIQTIFIFYAGRLFCREKQMDIKDWMAIHIHQHKKNPSIKKTKDDFFLLIPVVASNPAAGFMYGVGLSYTGKTMPSDTKWSTISGNLSNSTKGFLNINIKSNLFAAHEKWLLNGDWRYLAATETTYGLGSFSHSSAKTQLNGYEIEKDSIRHRIACHAR